MQIILTAASPEGGLFEKSLFYGKMFMIVCTVGNIEANYSHGTGITSFDGLMFQTLFGLYAGGFTVVKSYPIYSLLFMKSEEDFKPELEKFKEMIKNFDSRETIAFPWKAQAAEGTPDSAVLLAEGKIYH